MGVEHIAEFGKVHADAAEVLSAWLAEARCAKWHSPADIKERYATASFLSGPGNRVVFNIKGNTYRLLIAVAYKTGVVSIEALGTHAEYARWKL